MDLKARIGKIIIQPYVPMNYLTKDKIKGGKYEEEY